MPRPHERTRSRKHANKTPPSGGGRTQYKEKMTAPRHCCLCGQPLGGATRLSPLKASKLNRSERRVWRPFGGQLCHSCLKIGLRQAARKAQ